MSTEFSAFLVSRANQNCSPKTIIWYTAMLSHYDTWLAGQSLAVGDVRPVDIDRFLAAMRERGYAGNTITQFYTGLAAYYRWMLRVELIASNPVAKVQRPKLDEYIPQHVSFEYVSTLYSSITGDIWQDHRDRLVILLLWSTGLRCSAVAELRIADINLDTRILKVKTKNRNHQMPFPQELVLPIWQWLNIHRPKCDAPEMLVCQSYRNAVIRTMSRSCIDGILRKRSKAANMPIHSAHDYRHGFALHTLKAGASTRLVQKLLGHTKIATTERYLSLMPETIKEMADEVWSKQRPL